MIELPILISALSLATAAYVGLSNTRRNCDRDAAEQAAQLARIGAKLEEIGEEVHSMRADLKSLEAEAQAHRERLAVLEREAPPKKRRSK